MMTSRASILSGAWPSIETQHCPSTSTWNSAMLSARSLKIRASWSGGGDSIDQGEENLAVKNTALVRRTTRKTSESTSIRSRSLRWRPDSNRIWRSNQHSRSLGHRFVLSFSGYLPAREVKTLGGKSWLTERRKKMIEAWNINKNDHYQQALSSASQKTNVPREE